MSMKKGFCCDESDAQSGSTTTSTGGGNIGNGNDNPEIYQYYYHSDHLGSSSFITNLDGEVAQHIEYVPFGEVFVEERNNTWNTPYKFNGKELDEETGLYYYGARYMDPRSSLWLSVDQMAEKFPGTSSYAYCVNNPVKLIDPKGMAPTDIVYFSSNGTEIGRIKSNTEFKTYVIVNNNVVRNFKTGATFGTMIMEAPMPNVIQTRTQSGDDVTAPKYQENDYQIAASTFLTNRDLKMQKLIVADRGGSIISQSDLQNVPSIDVTMVKAWSMQESNAGTTGAILQVNNGGDFTPDKASIGITKGAVYSTHQQINLAIRYAIGKGFSITGVDYSDNGKKVTKTYSWNGWTEALKGYGPGAKNPKYQDYINTMTTESKIPTSSSY